MKKFALTAMCLLASFVAFGQSDPVDVLKKMDTLYDQFNNTFNANKVKDKLTIVFVPGGDNPFGKVYDRHKGKGVMKNVQFVGGFTEMMNNMPKESKKEHLQEAFVARYGKKHFTILLDLDSDIQQMFGNKGYALITISKKKNNIVSHQDFGTDRAAFFKALAAHMN